MARDYDKTQLFTRRAIMIGAAKLGLFSLLGGRIYYLQVMQGDKYKTLAEENRISLRMIAPPRGQILDRNSTPLAVNQQNYRLVLLPEQVNSLDQLLDHINGIVPLGENDRKRIARDIKNKSSFNSILVKDNLTWDQVSTLSLHSVDLPGTDIEVGEVRSYPYTTETAHLLGYVGSVAEKEMNDDEPVLSIPGFKIGKNGIEKFYERSLRGTAGTVQLEVNAHGRVIRELARHEPIIGKDLKLTIDLGLQQYTSNRLKDEMSAAAVVMDIHTGAVRAMVSHPGYDPNLFTYGIGQDDWDRLNTDIHTPLLNKAVNGAYAPGSTFKPVVAMAALDAGIDPAATVFCPGYMDLGEHRFHCWKHGGHGTVNLTQAMAGSCDTYFYDLGKRVGIDRMQAMAKRLGLGQKLGIDMPQERSGLVPGRAWKMAIHAGLWRQGETMVAAIGQGYTLATPLQLVTMAARIGNGGLAVAPRLVLPPDDQIPPLETLGLDPKNVALVQQSMAAVLGPMGTAYGSRIMDEKFAMAGKTGTAQVKRITMAEREAGILKGDAVPWAQRDHALFIAFAPVSNPRFAASVVIDHGGSGAHVAAPIARDLLIEAQKRLA